MHEPFNDTTPLPPPRYRSVDAERIAKAGQHLHRVPMPYEPASAPIKYEAHTAADDSQEGACGGDSDRNNEGTGAIVWPLGIVAILAVVFTLVHIGARLF